MKKNIYIKIRFVYLIWASVKTYERYSTKWIFWCEKNVKNSNLEGWKDNYILHNAEVSVSEDVQLLSSKWEKYR